MSLTEYKEVVSPIPIFSTKTFPTSHSILYLYISPTLTASPTPNSLLSISNIISQSLHRSLKLSALWSIRRLLTASDSTVTTSISTTRSVLTASITTADRSSPPIPSPYIYNIGLFYFFFSFIFNF
ncbi:hypothetical protein Sjap_004991 [Stephania japonica]|uniref:Uncharacterized protein n=1 Tax=Stephania japonica TaxID=461633 RepID=A0AAP0PHH0_9MAGN